MKWEMKLEEIETILEKIWDLHDKLRDAIHNISRSHFLNFINTLTKPNKNKPYDDALRVYDVDESAMILEAKSLNAIRTALENLEDQLEFFHADAEAGQPAKLS